MSKMIGRKADLDDAPEERRAIKRREEAEWKREAISDIDSYYTKHWPWTYCRNCDLEMSCDGSGY